MVDLGDVINEYIASRVSDGLKLLQCVPSVLFSVLLDAFSVLGEPLVDLTAFYSLNAAEQIAERFSRGADRFEHIVFYG